MADSGSASTNLTPEQKKFLEECELEFANRFTDADEDYKKVYDRDITTPPIVSPWYGRSRHPAGRAGQRNYQGRSDRDRYENRESRYDRHRDGREDGNSHQRYRPY